MAPRTEETVAHRVPDWLNSPTDQILGLIQMLRRSVQSQADFAVSIHRNPLAFDRKSPFLYLSLRDK